MADLELFDASKEGNIDRLRKLLDEGANPKAADKEGKTALYWAVGQDALRQRQRDAKAGDTNCDDRYLQVVQELLDKGVNVNALTKLGQTALHIASIFATNEVVRLLLEAGTDTKIQDKAGWTAVNHAVAWNLVDKVQLLGTFGCDMNIKDVDGKTPIHYAASQGHEEIIQVMVKAGGVQTQEDTMTLQQSKEAAKQRE